MLSGYKHLSDVLSEIGDEGAQTLVNIVHRTLNLIVQDTANQNTTAT